MENMIVNFRPVYNPGLIPRSEADQKRACDGAKCVHRTVVLGMCS